MKSKVLRDDMTQDETRRTLGQSKESTKTSPIWNQKTQVKDLRRFYELGHLK